MHASHWQCSAFNLHHHPSLRSWSRTKSAKPKPYPYFYSETIAITGYGLQFPFHSKFLLALIIPKYIASLKLQKFTLKFQYQILKVENVSRRLSNQHNEWREWPVDCDSNPLSPSPPYLSFSVLYIYYRFLNTVTLLAAVCLNVCFVRGIQLIFKTLVK